MHLFLFLHEYHVQLFFFLEYFAFKKKNKQKIL